MRELGVGTVDPSPEACEPRELPAAAASYYVTPRGDQTVLDGLWRLEIDEQDMLDAGLSAQDAYANAGVWEFRVTNGYADGVQPDGRPCNGDFAFDGKQVSFEMGVRGVEDCNGVARGTYRIKGNRVFFDWQTETRVRRAPGPGDVRLRNGEDRVTVALSRVLVALVALAVVTLVPMANGASPTAPWVSVAAVALASGLAAVRAPRQSRVRGAHRPGAVAGVPRSPAGWRHAGPLVGARRTADRHPVRRACPRPRRPETWLLATGALVAGPVRTLVYDPLLDPACRACRGLPTLLPLPPSTAAAFGLVGGMITVLGLVVGLRRGPTRMPLAGLVAVGLWALTGWSDVHGTVPEAAEVAALLACIGAGLLLMRTLVARTHLQRLAVALASGTAPQDSLRRTLGDSSLTLDFGVTPEEWVDADGRPFAGPATGQVTTQVLLDAEVVARVHHGPDSGRADSLASSLTPELLLAIEHARLTARLEAQVRQLQASRARVVEAADEARRRLERDLHDGAQQELLALGFDLRRALAAAPQDACLARSMEELTAAWTISARSPAGCTLLC